MPAPRQPTAEELLTELGQLAPEDPARDDLRRRIVALYEPLVSQLANKYRNRGEPVEDLRQTAMLGVMKAIRGYDVDYGKQFISYLLPMVTGELKRHFRDTTWAVRVPRKYQERRAELHRVTDEFTQRAGRSPKLSEIAKELEMTVQETTELIDASASYSALSLDAPYGDGEEERTLADSLGESDTKLENAVDRLALRPALTKLPVRERRIVMLRFFGNKTQSQIATEMGLSQMHVSRLLARTLAELRKELLPEE